MRPNPIRALHLFGTMDRGGAQIWIMNMLKAMDRSRVHLDFLCLSGEAGVLAPEIQSLGSCVHLLKLSGKNIANFIVGFNNLLKAGNYDVVHSHVAVFSGLILWLAAFQKIPLRLAHFHTTQRTTEGRSEGLARQFYLSLMGGLLDRSTSRFLACSKAAMTGIMGEGWESNPKCEVLYYGIDLSRFQTPVNREKIRQELGIAQNLQVIGHVGNFNLAKNHEFIVSLAEELSKVRKDVCFLLVGGGERRQYIEELVQSKGLHGQFIFTGSRPDVPQLMQAMDIFVLPSVREGLAIVLIEAQAAGLPLITSKLPAFEEVVFTPRHRALPFEIGRWVAACQEFLSQSNERKVSDRMWKDLERFSVEKCAQRLTEIYLSGF